MKAKQLLEEAGLSETPWGKVIIQAEEGGFTGKQQIIASQWTTCACGKQDPRIPRDDKGTPVDAYLARLGISFSRHVDCDQM